MLGMHQYVSCDLRFICQFRLQVSAIMAVGLMEGATHVNWRKFWAIVAWWYLGCVPVFTLVQQDAFNSQLNLPIDHHHQAAPSQHCLLQL